VPVKSRKTSKNTWSLQDAKARFSELVRLAETKGPQRITRHGEEVVVIVRASEYEATKKKPSLVEFFRDSPLAGQDWDFPRDKSHPRDIKL